MTELVNNINGFLELLGRLTVCASEGEDALSSSAIRELENEVLRLADEWV